jgi:hypothetical protein
LSERRGEVREGKEKKKARVEKGVKKRVVEGVSRLRALFVVCVNKIKIIFIAGHF